MPIAVRKKLFSTKILYSNLQLFSNSTLNSLNDLRIKSPLRFYSTKIVSLDPWFITGFTDAEGSFNVSISKTNSQLGWRVQCRYIIELHIKDLHLIEQIKSYFNSIGSIHINKHRNTVTYSVVGLKDIFNVILPHFDKYSLQSSKNIDFIYWRKCVMIMYNNLHIEKSGFFEILSYKSIINKGLSQKYRDIFKDVKVLERPLFVPNDIKLSGNWISGFTSGDGSFYALLKNNSMELAYSFHLDLKDAIILHKITEYFGFGNVSLTKNSVHLKVRNVKNLLKIISHFDVYPLHGFKLFNYLIWKDLFSHLINKDYLDDTKLIAIKELISRLNKWD